MDKYKKYEQMKRQLQNNHVEVGMYKEINYGIQFDVSLEGQSSKIRIYESKKKGMTVDLSQLRSEKIKEIVMGNMAGETTQQSNQKTVYPSQGEVQVDDVKGIANLKSSYRSDDLRQALIGVDESGKGDYFGPLAIAGVYADYELKLELIKMGVADSKKLSDTKILELAARIKARCPYEIICMNNPTYNRLYGEIKNLNHLLAWAHAKIIEKLWTSTKSEIALSDQFAKDSHIKRRLEKLNVDILLEERPRAEENVVVAAASILARATFVEHMHKMEDEFAHVFPKGAGPGTVAAAKSYVRTYGKDQLNQVAKLHFKTTEQL